jgi:hypothetical protein
MSTPEPARPESSARPPSRRDDLLLLLTIAAFLATSIVLFAWGCAHRGDDGGAGATTATSAESASGALVVDGESVFEHVNNATLRELIGRRAAANAVEIESVVNEAGFWVGTNEANRVFVEVEGEEDTEVVRKPGDTVSFDGAIEQNLEAEAYGLRTESDVQQFRDLGAHIRVQAGELSTP